MLLTRLGWNSTMVVTGDPDQSDLLPRISGLEAECCPPPFGIEHSGSCLRFPIETLTLAATVGANVEVSLLNAMRFTAVLKVRNIRIRRDRLERLQLV